MHNQNSKSTVRYRNSEAAASAHTETVLIPALRAAEGDQLRPAASSPFITDDDAFAFAPGTDPVLDHSQLLVLLPEIIDIAHDTPHSDDEEKKQQVDVDSGLLVTRRSARGASRASV